VGDVSRRSRHTGELRRGYRHPIRKDRVLWFALGLTAILVVVEFALASPSTPLGWLAFGLLAAALAFLVITLTGIFAGTIRGFVDGWRARDREVEGATAKVARPQASPDEDPDTPADEDRAPSSSGAVPPLPRPEVPESVKKLAATAQAKAPKQADVERTARALGRAASAARKAYRQDD